MAGVHASDGAARIEADKRSLHAWREFLSQYANGQLVSGDVPLQPPLPPPFLDHDACSTSTGTAVPEEMGSDFENPVYDSIEISDHTARRVREYYRRHSFLPPPRAPLESLREQCIAEYDLYSSNQIENMQTATDLVQAFLGGICTFTLFRNDIQELSAISGPTELVEAIGLSRGKRLLPETSFCGHSVLNTSGNLYIPNLAHDWRYSGNPFADEFQGVKSYYGTVLWLRVDPASLTDDRLVPIGVINSMHPDKFLPPLDANQEKVITQVTRMLQTQFRATWEGQARTREAKARRAISDLIESSLVQPMAPTFDSSRPLETSFGVGVPGMQVEEDSLDLGDLALSSLERNARKAVRRIRGVIPDLDLAGVIDLRSVSQSKFGADDEQRGMDAESHAHVLAWQTQSAQDSAPSFGAACESIVPFMERWRDSPNNMVFDKHADPSGLEPLLPPSFITHIAMPFFDGDDPLFLFLVATSRPFYRFRPVEVNLVRSLGVVLRAQIIQSRVVEADAAKTAFLSSISHELRTPMHGVLSGLQLIRDAFDCGDHEGAENLLRMTESSGHALEHILNDVLDFGSFSQDREGKRRKVLTDLGTAALNAARTCSRGMMAGEEARVELVVELEERDWSANADEAGIQRILFNGLTNAMKFTKTGRITLSLTSSPDNSTVICRVKDSGPGIDPQFLSKLFEPFTKANSFTPGAGLGLYITKSLVARLGGEIDLANRPHPEGGAVFTVTLPLELLASRPENPTILCHTVQHEIVSSSSCKVDKSVSAYHTGTQEAEAGGSTVTQCGPASGAQASGQAQEVDDLVIDVDAVLHLSPPTATAKTSPPSLPVPLIITDEEGEDAHTLRVLVVDDNAIGRKIICALLAQLSRIQAIRTEQAVDGLEAIEVFKTFRPHLVLSDVSMPGMDGITAASEMRKFERHQHQLQHQTQPENLNGGTSDPNPNPNPDRRCKIYAITGLGSSDPRLTMDALRGSAALDGWLVKGQDKLSKIKEIVAEVRESRTSTPTPTVPATTT